MRRQNYKNHEGISLVIVALGITSVFAFASFVIDVGMILNAQNELQKAVESAALVGSSNLEPKIDGSGLISIDTSGVEDITTSAFNKMKNSSTLTNAAKNLSIVIKPESKAVKVFAELDVNTYFINLVGLRKVTVQAQAAAISSPLYLSGKFPQSFNSGSIISETSGDTDIRKPVGDNKNENDNLENIFGYPDNKPLSLGPGGYITIRLPVPLVDKPGADLYIRELGNLEGYYVFVGNDVNSDNPYQNEGMPGSGIEWTNISCTGIPVGISPVGKVGAYYTSLSYYNGTEVDKTKKAAKFYGSGYFDLGMSCSIGGTNIYNPNVKNAKYIKIIDDNLEDGFFAGESSEPVLLIGDHSSITPGVDIDSVGILHHTRLISVNDFNIDDDGDGLINILEEIIGTNTDNADSDNDGINDATEYIGWYSDGSNNLSIIDTGSSNVNFTNPLKDENGAIYIKK